MEFVYDRVYEPLLDGRGERVPIAATPPPPPAPLPSRSMAEEVSDLVSAATRTAERLGVARVLRRVVGELHAELTVAGHREAAERVLEWSKRIGSEEGV